MKSGRFPLAYGFKFPPVPGATLASTGDRDVIYFEPASLARGSIFHLISIQSFERLVAVAANVFDYPEDHECRVIADSYPHTMLISKLRTRRIEDRGLRIKNPESRSQNRRSRIKV